MRAVLFAGRSVCYLILCSGDMTDAAWRACCLRVCLSSDARVHAAAQFPQVSRVIACDEDLPDAHVRILQKV